MPDDKDKNYSKKQILKKLDNYIVLQDAEVKEIPTDEVYKMHQENYDRMLKSIKKGIEETKKIKE